MTDEADLAKNYAKMNYAKMNYVRPQVRLIDPPF